MRHKWQIDIPQGDWVRAHCVICQTVLFFPLAVTLEEFVRKTEETLPECNPWTPSPAVIARFQERLPLQSRPVEEIQKIYAEFCKNCEYRLPETSLCAPAGRWVLPDSVDVIRNFLAMPKSECPLGFWPPSDADMPEPVSVESILLPSEESSPDEKGPITAP